MQLYPLRAPFGYPIHHLLLLLVAIAVLFGVYPFAGLLLQTDGNGFATNRSVPDFELVDVRGNTRSLSDFRGRYVFLMFGFMRCADICHTQVTRLAALAEMLAGRDVEFLYLAMDSRHDEPSLLHAYFDQRGDNFTSLHANSLPQMQSIASAFNAGYRISGNPGSDSYDIEHPGKIFLIGPDGQLRLVYSGAKTTTGQIAANFNRLNPPAPTANL